MRYTDVLVGVDGSAPSRAALRWAAAEARRRDARLRILTTYSWGWSGPRYGGADEVYALGREQFEDLMAACVVEARGVEPGLEVTGTVVVGDAAQMLLDAARAAAVVVVGNRGHGGFTSLLLGSVSQRVATHATVPVVVVRGRTDAAPGPVAVGVDGSIAADHALGLAFAEAQRRDCALVAVRAYGPPPRVWIDLPDAGYETDDRQRVETDALRACVAPWLDKYPTVPVEILTGPGGATAMLVDVSSRAGLLIVGTRGHGALAGALLGSVSQQLLHHADCPVMIAHREHRG